MHQQLAVMNQDIGFAAEQQADMLAFQAEKRKKIIDQEQGDGRDQAIQKRRSRAVHRRGRYFGNDERDNQLIRLKLPRLFFAHQPHGKNDKNIDDNRFNNDVKQTLLLLTSRILDTIPYSYSGRSGKKYAKIQNQYIIREIVIKTKK